MQSQYCQVGDWGHTHDILEGVLWRPLASAGCCTKIGNRDAFFGLARRIFFGDLNYSTVVLQSRNAEPLVEFKMYD